MDNAELLTEFLAGEAFQVRSTFVWTDMAGGVPCPSVVIDPNDGDSDEWPFFKAFLDTPDDRFWPTLTVSFRVVDWVESERDGRATTDGRLPREERAHFLAIRKELMDAVARIDVLKYMDE